MSVLCLNSGEQMPLVLEMDQMKVHEFKNVIRKLCYILEKCSPESLGNAFQMTFP